MAEKDTLTFEEALQISLAAESAKQNARDISAVGSTAQVHSMKVREKKEKVRPNSTGKCFSCGGSHLRYTCKFRDAECHNCHKKGHIKKVCGLQKGEKSQLQKHPKAHYVQLSAQSNALASEPPESTENQSEKSYEFTIRQVNAKSVPIVTTINVNGMPINMESRYRSVNFDYK